MALSDLKAVVRADVYKAGRKAAALHRHRDHVRFEYVEGWSVPPVASTLPIGKARTTTSANALPAFFAGLLPEGRRLTALRSAIKTSADDDFSLLLAVGGDVIGDVQVAPEGVSPVNASVETPALAKDVVFADLFEAIVGRDPTDLVGLPGVQPKVSGKMISLPLRWGDHPCVLKLNPPEFAHLVDNEAFFYRAARASGLVVADAQVVYDAAAQPGLLVRRFDRERTDAGIVTRAQEDGCQALDRYPADKYRLTTGEVFEALARVTAAPVVAARDLIRQLAFAYITCNGDAHAKNFSVVQAPSGEWRVSPAYDLPSSHPYGDTTMAMSVAGKDREDIGRRQFLALGERLGLPERTVGRVLDGLVRSADGWLDGLEGLPFHPQVALKLRRAIAYRCRRLAA